MVGDITAERRSAEARGGKYELTLDEQIERFEESIGLRVDWEAVTLEQHKKWLAAQGKEFDGTPIQLDWRAQDREIPGNYMHNPNDPARKGKE
jgi:hypothetical protein